MSHPSIFSALQKIRHILTRNEKIKALGIVGFALVTSFFEVLTATLVVIFAKVLSQPESGQTYLSKVGFSNDLSPGRIIFVISITIGVTYFIKNLIAGLEVFYQNFTIQKMNYHLKGRMLERYAQADYAQYLTRNSSFGLHVVGNDTEQIFTTGVVALASIVTEATVFLALVGTMVYLSPSLALILFLAGGLVGLFVTKVLLPLFYKFGDRLENAALLGNQNLMQFFHAFKEIALLGKRDYFIKRCQFFFLEKTHVQAKQTAVNGLPRIVIEVLFVGLFVTAIAVMCWEQEAPTAMMSVLGGYLYAGFRVMPGLNRMVNQLNTFKMIIPSIERLSHEYLTVSRSDQYKDVPHFTFEKNLTLEDVTFRYPHTKKDALKHISLSIPKGSCVGIVGATGSGKSTLVDLILGLLTPASGRICVDGTFPVQSHNWHHMIGYVPQSIYLVDDTIEANIAFGEEAADPQKLHDSIAAAQLTSFIEALPEGVRTLVGERGVRLSGGERQRIAIARALYRNPDVLIFDEATSALDTQTEEKLMDTIYHVSQNRTVLMIAHRLSTLKRTDHIVVMEKGVMKEITTYTALEKKD